MHWKVPVMLTEATTGKGVADVLDAVFQHREFLRASGGSAAHSAAARHEEFVEVLREEISRRLEASLENGHFTTLLQQIKRGDIDPYKAALQVMADEHSVRVLLGAGQPGVNG